MYQNFSPCMDAFHPRCSYKIDEKLNKMELARAYVPDQSYSGLLPLDVAFKRGTIFSNINMNYPRI